MPSSLQLLELAYVAGRTISSLTVLGMLSKVNGVYALGKPLNGAR